MKYDLYIRPFATFILCILLTILILSDGNLHSNMYASVKSPLVDSIGTSDALIDSVNQAKSTTSVKKKTKKSNFISRAFSKRKMKRNARRMSNDFTFRFRNINSVLIDSLNVLCSCNVSDLTEIQLARVTSGVDYGEIDLDIDIIVNNFNNKLITIDRFNWVLYVDEAEVDQNEFVTSFDIYPTSRRVIRINAKADINFIVPDQTDSENTLSSLINTINYASLNSRFSMTITPSILIDSVIVESVDFNVPF